MVTVHSPAIVSDRSLSLERSLLGEAHSFERCPAMSDISPNLEHAFSQYCNDGSVFGPTPF